MDVLWCISSLLLLTTLLYCVSFGEGSDTNIDVTKEPGHLKRFGDGRIVHKVQEVQGIPDPETFIRDFLIPQTPVIFKHGAEISPAFKLWTDEYFINMDIPKPNIVGVETLRKEDRNQEHLTMDFQEFVKIYKNSTYYMVDKMPHFLKKDVNLPHFLQCADIINNLSDIMMWFSAGGTNSVVHRDGSNNLNCVFRGTKDFVLVDPVMNLDLVPLDRPEGAYSTIDVDSVDYVKYPTLTKVEYTHAHMEPGDCLLIPNAWIHQVRSYGISLAMNIWWQFDPVEDQIDINTCNKTSDSTFTLDGLQTRGFEAELFISDALMRLRKAMDNSMSSEELVELLVPDITSLEDNVYFKEESTALHTLAHELINITDLDKNGKITYDEVAVVSMDELRKILVKSKQINDNIDTKIHAINKKSATLNTNTQHVEL